MWVYTSYIITKMHLLHLLISVRLHISVTTQWGNSALMIAAIKGMTEVVSLLLKAGANTDFQKVGQCHDVYTADWFTDLHKRSCVMDMHFILSANSRLFRDTNMPKHSEYLYVIPPFGVVLPVYLPNYPRARSARGVGRINCNTTTKGGMKCLLPLIGRC